MSNTYFQFKQFVIHQDRCAMKVCTDASIFGAWFSGKIPAGASVLDIGSGTGLLMLMLAQQHDGPIRGIELDLYAFGQLQENLAGSPWKEMLEAWQGDVRTFAFPQKFDRIISNPPFFEGDLHSASHSENLAKHSKELTLSELIGVIDANLSDTGSFGILLPYHRTDYFEELAAGRGFHLQEKLQVRQTPAHDYFRAILYFSRRKDNFTPQPDLTIRDAAGVYTEAFVELLKGYYLYL